LLFFCLIWERADNPDLNLTKQYPNCQMLNMP
jgi:hypothetical protein